MIEVSSYDILDTKDRGTVIFFYSKDNRHLIGMNLIMQKIIVKGNTYVVKEVEKVRHAHPSDEKDDYGLLTDKIS